jgi:hypothetical protein
MEDTEILDDHFTWNPDAMDEFNGASVKFRDNNYLVTADTNISQGSIIYRGEPLTSRASSMDENIGLEYTEWAVRIMQHIKGHDKYLLDLYPRYIQKDLNIRQITEKLSLNIFGINNTILLYIGGSKFNHSCTPNAGQNIDPVSNIIIVYALKDIRKDEEITITYFDALSTIENIKTRAEILARWKMKCQCPSCLDQNNPQPLEYFIDIINDLNDWFKNDPITNCVWCGKGKIIRVCSECGIPKYCSRKCQTRHWQLYHKRQCQRWSQQRTQLTFSKYQQME